MDWQLRLGVSCLSAALAWLPFSALGADYYAGSQPRQQTIPTLGVAHPSSEHAHPEQPTQDQPTQDPGHGTVAVEECHDFDWIEEYQHNHDTADGFPRIHLLKIEHAWLDPHWQIKYTGGFGHDHGETDEHEFEFEYFHVFNNRLAAVIGVPYSFLNPDAGPKVNGFGDLAVGLQWLAFNGEYSQLSFGLAVHAPTGDDGRGLGEGHSALEPTMLWYYDLGCGNALQTQFSLVSPLAVREVDNEFEYNIGYSHTFAGTENARFFRWLTPLIELNGSTLLNGEEYGRTVVNLTPGVRWIVGEENQMGVGMSFPVTGDREANYEVIVSYIAHY